jgi:hypothetical protein
MTTLYHYLYRPKQLRDHLARALEPLRIVFRLKCWLLGFHNFGVDEDLRQRRKWNVVKRATAAECVRSNEWHRTETYSTAGTHRAKRRESSCQSFGISSKPSQ